jgi:hypothetical protein
MRACVHMRARARVWAIASCDVPLWRCQCSAYSDARLGFAQNAAGTAPVSVLFARSILVTARSEAIESGMVPTKRLCWKRLHRSKHEGSLDPPRPSFREPDALRQRLQQALPSSREGGDTCSLGPRACRSRHRSPRRESSPTCRCKNTRSASPSRRKKSSIVGHHRTLRPR